MRQVGYPYKSRIDWYLGRFLGQSKITGETCFSGLSELQEAPYGHCTSETPTNRNEHALFLLP